MHYKVEAEGAFKGKGSLLDVCRYFKVRGKFCYGSIAIIELFFPEPGCPYNIL
jgi:hypothetical protein